MTAVRFAACHEKALPTAVSELTYEQAQGRACVSCGIALTGGAVDRGTVVGAQGVHDTSAQVWSCPPPAAAL